MKYEVDNKHREFFSEFGWLECEHVLPEETVHQAHRLVLKYLAERLKMPADRLDRALPIALYRAGRDLWRQAPEVKSVVCHRSLAEIAAQLVRTSPLRIGYDQSFINCDSIFGQDAAVPLRPATLAEVSSIQGMVCGVIIALTKPTSEEPSKPVAHIAPIPRAEGSCVYVSPDTRIDFPRLVARSDESYLLITYSEAVSCFVLCEGDICGASLKGLGYSYGDRLIDQHHPVIYQVR